MELLSSSRCLKIVSRFGNKKALQDSIYESKPKDDLETYSKVGEVKCNDVTNIVFVDQKVQVAESVD